MSGIRCPCCDYDVDECECEERWGPGGRPRDARDARIAELEIALKGLMRAAQGMFTVLHSITYGNSDLAEALDAMPPELHAFALRKAQTTLETK